MQRVNGIGGIFFRAKNPEMLSQWYQEHLGVTPPPLTYADKDWEQEAGPTVFGPMEATSPHFKNDAELFINFRVSDLEAMCEQLRRRNIDVVIDSEIYPNGKFASLSDPEGNSIQLWQPSIQ
jgi:glyoxylase I family protein